MIVQNPFNNRTYFGKELKKKVIQRVDRYSIGMWASSYHTDFDMEQDNFTDIAENVYRMCMSEEFLLSYEELEKIADDALTGKWIAQKQERSSSQEYLKIIVDFSSSPQGWSHYEDYSAAKNFQLYILAELLQNLGTKELIQFLILPKWESQRWNDVFLSKKKSAVHVYSNWGPFYNMHQQEILSAIFDIENLKHIADDWRKLYEEDRLSFFYLIIKKNSEIAVVRSLNNEDF